MSGIAGRTPLTAETRPLVPTLLTSGPALAFGPGGVGCSSPSTTPDRAPRSTPAPVPTSRRSSRSPRWSGGAGPRPGLPGRPGARRRRADRADRRAAARLDPRMSARWLRRPIPLPSPSSGSTRPTPTPTSPRGPPEPSPRWVTPSTPCRPPGAWRRPPRSATPICSPRSCCSSGTGRLRSRWRCTATRNGWAAYAGEAVRTSIQPLRWIKRLATPAGTRAARIALPAVAAAAQFGRAVTGNRDVSTTASRISRSGVDPDLLRRHPRVHRRLRRGRALPHPVRRTGLARRRRRPESGRTRPGDHGAPAEPRRGGRLPHRPWPGRARRARADAVAGRPCGSPRRGGSSSDARFPAVAAFNAPENIGLSAAEAAELTRMLRAVRDTLNGAAEGR